MKIRYNRFAFIPHVCNHCDEVFWLEPYKYCKRPEIKISGIEEVEVTFCKSCVDRSYEEEDELDN